MYLLRALFIVTTLSLVGCAGIGVFESSDPKVKLSDATYLFDKYDRPLIAERLIREAIEICQSKADQPCLADAYRTYGFFFRSPSIEGKWNKFFRENGFLDKSATFGDRYAKSIEYFEKAREIYARLERFDALTNVYLNMGFSYEFMGEPKLAYRAYDESSASNRENLRRNPDAHVELPKGFATVDDYLAPHRKRAERAIADAEEKAKEIALLEKVDCSNKETKLISEQYFRRGRQLLAANRYNEAMQCFLRAQEDKSNEFYYQESCHSIAMMYQDGLGVEKSPAIAKAWLDKRGL